MKLIILPYTCFGFRRIQKTVYLKNCAKQQNNGKNNDKNNDKLFLHVVFLRVSHK